MTTNNEMHNVIDSTVLADISSMIEGWRLSPVNNEAMIKFIETREGFRKQANEISDAANASEKIRLQDFAFVVNATTIGVAN